MNEEDGPNEEAVKASGVGLGQPEVGRSRPRMGGDFRITRAMMTKFGETE